MLDTGNRGELPELLGMVGEPNVSGTRGGESLSSAADEVPVSGE